MAGHARTHRCLPVLLLFLVSARATAGELLQVLLDWPHRISGIYGTRGAAHPRPTGAARALEWQALTMRDDTGRIDPEALYRANKHRRESLRRDRERFPLQTDAG